VGPVIKFRGETPASPAAPPMLGEHTAEVLQTLGYTQADIERLHDQGAIT
jgi:crotonobetainyl-CoA:carnitine CoA-transferase CaiB-like acyl-CoA transferase